MAWRKMEWEHALPLLARKIAVYVRQYIIGYIHSAPFKLSDGGLDGVYLIVCVMVYIAQYLGVGQGKEPHIKEVIRWMHTEGPSQAYAENTGTTDSTGLQVYPCPTLCSSAFGF